MHGDSSGREGIGETPQSVARGGSAAARGKRSVFPQRNAKTCFAWVVPDNMLLLAIGMEI
nr:hypothetical protein [Sediminibacillus dalangtanensis]